MIIIENTYISDDIAEKHFVCDLLKCKGACCVEGDLGAPLEENELKFPRFVLVVSIFWPRALYAWEK